MTDLPAPDPQAGEQAHEVAEQARRDAEESLRDGNLTLAGLFAQVEEESGSDHRPLGHMHLRRALIALPHVDEVRADRILADVGLDAGTHLAKVGTQQQQALADAADVESRTSE